MRLEWIDKATDSTGARLSAGLPNLTGSAGKAGYGSDGA